MIKICFTVILFLLVACNNCIELSDDFGIKYSDVTDKYHISYKQEGFYDFEILENCKFDDNYILIEFINESNKKLLFINKTEFSNSYKNHNGFKYLILDEAEEKEYSDLVSGKWKKCCW